MISCKDVLSHETAIAFYDASTKYGLYCRGGREPPAQILDQFKKALQEYRDYLDSIGIYRATPKTR